MNSKLNTYGTSSYLTLPDGRKLHYWQHGDAGPTVVFESGMGFSGALWGKVQPLVSHSATTIVYDRAGLGRSDSRSGASNLSAAVSDLAALLRSLEHLQPFVLVGSSWGGPIIRSLAATGEFPVRGLVLVDQSDENAPEYFEPSAKKRFESTGKLLIPMARFGLYKLIGQGIGKTLPADVRKDHLDMDFGVRSAQTMAAELQEFLNDMQYLKDHPSRLEGIEVSVISGTKISRSERKIRPAINQAHRQTAQQLANARLVEADKSGHYVMFSEPQLVANEILSMLDPSS